MPKSLKTGRDKKLTRVASSAERKNIERGRGAYRRSLRQVEALGRGEGLPEADPSKILEAYKGSQELAKQYFEPQKELALQEYNQMIAPEVRNQFAGGAGSRTSALNQALAASATNLSRQLNADYQNLSLGLGQDLANRQQRGQEFNVQSRLQALQQGLDQRHIGPLGTNVALQPNYLPPSNAPSKGKSAFAGATQGALTGFLAGGPWGALAGGALGGAGGYFGGGGGSSQAGQFGGQFGTAMQDRALQQQAGSLPMPKWGG